MMDGYEHLSLVSETAEHVSNYLIVAGDNKNVSDIIIYCKDNSVRACKMILASVSQMFYELLKEDSETSAIFATDIMSSNIQSWLLDIYRKKDHSCRQFFYFLEMIRCYINHTIGGY